MGFGKKSIFRLIIKLFCQRLWKKVSGKLKDCASKINTGLNMIQKPLRNKFGLNGVGIKAVNAYRHFKI